jgi:dimethylargininase
MKVAITRQVSPNFDQCELTHLARTPIDVPLAKRQHSAYEAALAANGYQVTSLPPSADLPDSVFVEDAALVFDEVGVLTRPGAHSRRLETEAIAPVLARHREVVAIEPPGVIDGGDVLTLGRQVFVGISSRTNSQAIEQLEKILAPWNYRVIPVPVTGCLHLKSAVTQVADNTLLINREWVNEAYFQGWQHIEVDPQEPGGANALFLGDQVIYPTTHASTLVRLQEAGIRVLEVDVSEVLKAEGGVTCCSLVLGSPQAGRS